MRATIPFIKSVFRKYNLLAFDGMLPEPPFQLVSSRALMGRTRIWDTQDENGDVIRKAVIDISIRYDLPEKDYINTIVHEMIHYYIWYNKLTDDGPHGHLFISLMKEISEKCNVEISVVGEYTEEMLTQEPTRTRYVCIAIFEDSSCAMAVIARGKLFQLWNSFENIKGISSVSWYATSDQYFGRFPTTVTPRLYGVDVDDVFPHLENAIELENSGTRIHPKQNISASGKD